MEITNEIKSKVFAQYLGQKYQRTMYYASDIKAQHSKSIHELKPMSLTCIDDNPSVNIGKTVDLLILKPLSSITDEDAIAVSNMRGNFKEYFTHGESQVLKLGKMYIEEYGLNIAKAQHDTIFICQFLQSKGYDLPNYLLGNKTLNEAELAIYE